MLIRYAMMSAVMVVGCSYNLETPKEVIEEKTMVPFDDMAGDYAPSINDKKKGWQNFGKLHTGNTLKEVALQADFPDAWSYVLEFSKGNDPNGNTATKAEAFIKWSVEGGFVTRRVSVGNGVTVQGVAQGVKVTINDVTASFGAIPPGVDTDYDVSVQVTRGSRGTNSLPPTLSQAAGLINIPKPGGAPFRGSQQVNIPADAGVTSAFLRLAVFNAAGDTSYAIPQGSVVIQQLQGPGIFIPYYYNDNSSFIPIIPGTTALLIIVNYALLDVAAVGCSGEVIWGIDG